MALNWKQPRSERSLQAHWGEVEFSDLDLGDKRLERRFKKTVERLSEQPVASINQACEDWAETKGAYRLFGNEKLGISKILAAHRKSIAERIEADRLSRILLIQDTSFLNYTEHFSTLGLGEIGRSKTRSGNKVSAKGLVAHTTLAISPEGLSLGVIDQSIWARKPFSENPKLRKKDLREFLPVEEKESYKWLRALDEAMLWVPENVQAITVADRESDIFEFVARAEKHKTYYTIRSAWNRSVRVEHEANYLWDHLLSLDAAGTYEIEVEVPRTAKEKIGPKRIALLEVRFGQVEIKRPANKKIDKAEYPPFLRTYAVLAKEVKAPKGIEALEWMLLTNVPVESFNDAKERIDWYKLRWHIESFHKVLKSGLGVERCRLETVDRLERYITVCSIIAWRLYWMTHLSRNESGDNCCSSILEEHEWKALYCRVNKTTGLPKKPPTIRQAVRWIAGLGGFLGRKGDGEPGFITLWRGWQRLTDIAEDWLLFNQKTCG